MKQGKIFLFSGPSGAGKSTIIKALLERDSDAFFSVSATTRSIRGGEQEGVDYLYVSREAFQDMIAQDRLLEWAEYVDNFYGTPADPVLEKLQAGCDVFLDIETRGARQVVERFPGTVTIFVAPKSFAALEQRLRKRGTNSEEDIQKRLKKGRAECENAGMYTYLILNDTEEQAIADAVTIIRAEHLKSRGRLHNLKGE